MAYEHASRLNLLQPGYRCWLGATASADSLAPSLSAARYRNYHPALGRWIERDPEGYVDGMSLYQYCCSNPAGMTDPQGLYSDNETTQTTEVDEEAARYQEHLAESGEATTPKLVLTGLNGGAVTIGADGSITVPTPFSFNAGSGGSLPFAGGPVEGRGSGGAIAIDWKGSAVGPASCTDCHNPFTVATGIPLWDVRNGSTEALEAYDKYTRDFRESFVVYYNGADWNLLWEGNNLVTNIWRIGTVLYSVAGYRPIEASSPDDAKNQMLADLGPNQKIDTIKFWGHNIGGVEVGKGHGITVGDFTYSPNDTRNDYGSLCEIRNRLDGSSLVDFEACKNFEGESGSNFAKAAAEFFGCPVGGYLCNIGTFQPGYRVLKPGQDPKTVWEPLRLDERFRDTFQVK